MNTILFFPQFHSFLLFLIRIYQSKNHLFHQARDGILLPKLLLRTVRKNCSSDREKLLKVEAEGQEFAKFLRSLEQFIQAVKGQNNFLKRMLF